MHRIHLNTVATCNVFAIACAAIFAYGAHTVNAVGQYSVHPLVIDEEMEAREVITKDITITNNSDGPLTIYPTVNNISLKEGGTIEEFLTPVESDRTASLAAWLEISRRVIELRAGESATVPLIIRINPAPKPGTYHAFVGFASGGNRDQAEKLVASGLAPGTVVTVTIAEKTTEFLKLAKFIVSRFVTRSENEAATFTFRNPGDETLVPEGEIIFFDSTGREVGARTVNEEHVTIAPGGEHTFTSSVPTEGMFGKYKAFLSVEYGNSQRASIQDTHFFYVFPIKTIAVALGLLLIAVTAMSWHIHRRYFDTETYGDSDRITLHLRDTESEPAHHDIDLKKSS